MPVRGLACGACGLVAGWEGQLSVLAPWDVTVVAACVLPRQLPSTTDLGVNYMMNNNFM